MIDIGTLLEDDDALRELAKHQGTTAASVRKKLEAALEAQRLQRVADALVTMRDIPAAVPAMCRQLLQLDDDTEKAFDAGGERLDVTERRNGVRSALYSVARGLELVEPGAKHPVVRDALRRVATAGELPPARPRTLPTTAKASSETEARRQALLAAMPGTTAELRERTNSDGRGFGALLAGMTRCGMAKRDEAGVWIRIERDA